MSLRNHKTTPKAPLCAGILLLLRVGDCMYICTCKHQHREIDQNWRLLGLPALSLCLWAFVCNCRIPTSIRLEPSNIFHSTKRGLLTSAGSVDYRDRTHRAHSCCCSTSEGQHTKNYRDCYVADNNRNQSIFISA